MSDDFLDALMEAEQRALSRGSEAGRHEGIVSGFPDGLSIGLRQGYQCGLDVGRGAALAALLPVMLRTDRMDHPSTADATASGLSGRQMTTLHRLGESARRTPIGDPTNEQVLGLLAEVKRLLKLVLVANGSPRAFHPLSAASECADRTTGRLQSTEF
eukprot:ANDGO_08133.mRNA.1 hypothetical protein